MIKTVKITRWQKNLIGGIIVAVANLFLLKNMRWKYSQAFLLEIKFYSIFHGELKFVVQVEWVFMNGTMVTLKFLV